MKSKVQMSFTLTSLKNILGKQCTEKHFNKKIAMAEKDDGDFENSTKCWIDRVYVNGDVKR